ncbi:opsin-3-like [Pecten maximus]|uniref:opsin-3-like n=1 Tax=Pecten maximus TaxID=6579 RepID=UPI001458AB3B|nr:opsin-3-like [Pecten maximus]
MSLNISSENSTGLTPFLSTYAYVVIGVLMTGASIVGIGLNGLFVYVFWRQTSLKTPTNYFILALSLLDFIMSLFGLPMVAISCFGKHWVFGAKGCVYYGFIMTFVGLSIITILATISFDRYIVIVKTHLKSMISQRVAVSMIIVCLLYGLAWAIAPLVGWSEYVLEGVSISCSVNWTSDTLNDASFSVAMLILCLLVPVGVILFCYGNIFYKVRRSGHNQTLSDSDRGSKMDRDVAKTILWMILAFIVSWSPYALLSMTAVIGGASTISPGLSVCPTILAKISVVWNPLIYSYRNREIRRSMLEFLPFLHCWLNLPCVRLQGQGQIRPDMYRNDTTGMVALPSTSTEGTQTTGKRLPKQGIQLEDECTELNKKAASMKTGNNPTSRLKVKADMFTVRN